jgi:hypothetical protein
VKYRRNSKQAPRQLAQVRGVRWMLCRLVLAGKRERFAAAMSLPRSTMRRQTAALPKK